uniref:Protein kinase domain-containing protein n=1 Tax=Oryza punctata TaxID=4537 RepID=A0A0E0K3W4_ORYPU
MAKLRERRQLRLSVPASPPFPHQEHPFAALLSTPPGSPGLAELEILSVVGRGSGGTVYRARHRLTGATLAVKEMRDDGAALREAGAHLRVAAAAPDHPSVVRLHGVCVGHPVAGNRFVYLVLEYLPEGSLSDVLVRGALPEPAIARVARCVLRGLSHLHRLGVAHGDVKPSNLLVGHRGEIKIADFGASRVVTSRDDCEEAHHQSPGTWAYMSPEKLHPEGFGATVASPGVVADFSGDVWSLGVVLLECHAGRFPLVAAGERPDWPALVLAVCFAAAPEVPVAASPEFGGFVRRCLEKDWRRRATVEELLGHPYVAGKPSRSRRQNEWLTTFHDKTGQVNTSIYGEDEIKVQKQF